ncbi:SRPBCC family protein [Aequorivita echinoideorum]|uniref:SRPBCC family protein n=1 Tax=Aequorivita echinoideorum TaxID=1549647 RepID=A0ABS5S5P3_9FLAO|nr:SRPBCC family protein [Aequorivita echinoideorum]MBT0608541.1 SRPBCC family protein [Aequorivita echinoideorum]
MPKIILETIINADVKNVFDLSRNIDLHKISAKQTNETAIAGKTKGLIELGETVTWRAKHLGFYQTLTSKITEFEEPNYFVDEMVEGIFESFKHEHHFKNIDCGTLMVDIFEYKSPFGIFGKMADILFLKNYLTKFLKTRNKILKQIAEA